jgi:hypothetical protein
MGVVETQRTLVKSVPEVWAQLSERDQLQPLLGETFGEITITRLEPETRIAWEGELASGVVELEPSGFGTRVRLTAQVDVPEPPPSPESPPAPRRTLLARILRRPQPPAPVPEPLPVAEPLLEPEVARSALATVLDEVGAARHRPFSRRD